MSGRIGCLFPFLCLLFFLFCILLQVLLKLMSADGYLHGIHLHARLVHVLLQICNLAFQRLLDHFILCGQMCGNCSVFGCDLQINLAQMFRIELHLHRCFLIRRVIHSRIGHDLTHDIRDVHLCGIFSRTIGALHCHGLCQRRAGMYIHARMCLRRKILLSGIGI